MSHLFISYSKRDIAFARDLRRRLEALGFAVWMDETALVASERWWRRIEENIRACSAFIVLMSEESESSDWVERELLLAERLRKPIFPILVEGEPWSRLANIQYVPMTSGVGASLSPDFVDGLSRYLTPRPGEVLAVPPQLSDAPPVPHTRPLPAPNSGRNAVLVIAAVLLVVVAAGVLLVPRLLTPPAPGVTVTVAPTPDPSSLPNLTVGRLRTSPRNPAPGEVFILSITLQNTGTAESGAFNWSWDSSLTDPVALNTLIGRVESIPPNGSKNISFPVSYGWWGTYNTQLVVDVDSEIIETDDRDNRRPFLLTLADAPFDVDFALVPPADVVEPPFTVESATFEAWNLRFSVAPPVGRDCPDARLRIVDFEGDLVMQVESIVTECLASRIRVDVLRERVGAVVVDLVPLADGETGAVSLFDSADAAEPFFTTTQVDLPADMVSAVGDESDTTRSIARFEIGTTSGAVRISRVTMLRRTG